MPIDPDFPRKYRIMGKHSHTDGKHYHLVWGPGKENGESSTDTLVQESYRKREEHYVPLGIHGTTVAVDWDSCIACGKCIEECPMRVFQWYRTEQDVPAFRVVNTTCARTGEDRIRDGRIDYTDKPDPISEHQCNWCMMCISVCPTQAIEVYQENKIYHQEEPIQWKSDLVDVVMKTESDFNYNYFITELESLGIRAEKLNELNDVYEIQNLVDNIKQMFIQDYKSFCDYGVNPA